MKESNQNLSEAVGTFLLEFRDDVVRGLQEYLMLNSAAVEVM